MILDAQPFRWLGFPFIGAHEMHRLALLGTLVVVLSGPVAAQTPKAAVPESLPGWGRVVSPNQKIKFKATDDALTIALPSGANDFSAELGRITAPHVLHPFRGDGTLQVRVSKVTPPGRISHTPGRKPFASAGLLIWKDERNYLRLEHARCATPNVVTYINWELRANGEWVRQGRFDELPLPGDSSWLKITRAGDVFTPSVSLDGQTWKTLPDIRTQAWPADLEAGIVAVNDTKVTFAPAFHDLLVNGKAPE